MAARDAVVVGAGPAGLTVAYKLARDGCRVTLISDPGGPVGEAPRTQLLSGKTLAALGDPLPDSLVKGRVNGTRWVSLKGECASSRAIAGRAALVSRENLLEWLTGRCLKAGVEVRRAQVRSVMNGRDSATVYTHTGAFVTRWVIGADGADSMVARAAGIGRILPAGPTGGTLTREWDGNFGPETDGYMEWMPLPSGFIGWLFRWPGGIQLGVHSAWKGKRALARAMTALQRQVSERARPPAGAPFHESAGRMTAAVCRPELGKGRVILVGDAAGMTDPFTGTGLSQAVTGGLQAARIILDHGGVALQLYRQWWRINGLREQRMAALMALACWKRGRSFFDVMRRNRVWVDIQADTMDGCAGYGSLWKEMSSRGVPSGRHKSGQGL